MLLRKSVHFEDIKKTEIGDFDINLLIFSGTYKKQKALFLRCKKAFTNLQYNVCMGDFSHRDFRYTYVEGLLLLYKCADLILII